MTDRKNVPRLRSLTSMFFVAFFLLLSCCPLRNTLVALISGNVLKTSAKNTLDNSIKAVESCTVFEINKMAASHERALHVIPTALLATWIIACFTGMHLWKRIVVLRREVAASVCYPIPLYLKNRVLLIWSPLIALMIIWSNNSPSIFFCSGLFTRIFWSLRHI